MGTGNCKPHKSSKLILGIQDPLYQEVGCVARPGGKYFRGISEEQRGAHSHFLGLISGSEPSAHIEMGTFADFRSLIFFSV